LAAVWEGRDGMWKKKKEKQRKRVSGDGLVYNGFFWWNHQRLHSVGDSIRKNHYIPAHLPTLSSSVSPSSSFTFHQWFHRLQCHVTVRLSQFESLGHFISKIIWRHHAVAYFQTNCIPRRWNGRYIPTDLETELCPSVIITDIIVPSVIPLVFSGFLVVLNQKGFLFHIEKT